MSVFALQRRRTMMTQRLEQYLGFSLKMAQLKTTDQLMDRPRNDRLTCHTPTIALHIKMTNITKGSTKAVT